MCSKIVEGCDSTNPLCVQLEIVEVGRLFQNFDLCPCWSKMVHEMKECIPMEKWSDFAVWKAWEVTQVSFMQSSVCLTLQHCQIFAKCAAWTVVACEFSPHFPMIQSNIIMMMFD